jgi:hypothetical protein
MRRRRPATAVVATCVLLLVTASSAHSETWQVDVSASNLEDDYGGAEQTAILYTPLTVRRLFQRGDLSVSVPFVSMNTQGEATGTSGLGDILLKGRLYAVEERGRRPSVDLAARFKLPTAAEGLGLGEPEAGLGVELSRRLDATHVLMADVLYTAIGNSPDTDYHNRVTWDVGVAWQPRRGVTIAFYYDYRSALREGRGSEQSVLLFGSRRVRPGLRLYGLIDVGLTAAASDLSLTAGFKYGFQ